MLICRCVPTGVARAAREARQSQVAAEAEAHECRAQAAEWEKQYKREAEKVANLRQQVQNLLKASPTTPPSLPARHVQRRNTIPPCNADTWPAQIASNIPPTALSAEPSYSSTSGGQGAPTFANALAAFLFLNNASRRIGLAPRLERQDTDSADMSTVSVADDGRFGVGPAAAAAVSVALAQSWAGVAGGGKCATDIHEATACVHPGKARFKLVAAVPRNLSLNAHRGAEPGNERHRREYATIREDEANGLGPSPSKQSLFPGDSSMALESIDDARNLDNSQEATWRASGGHLKMQWLSAPSAVLVVFKPSEEVLEATGEAVAWLLQRGIVVFAEPPAMAAVRGAAAAALEGAHARMEDNFTASGTERAESTGSSIFGAPETLTAACEEAASKAEAAREARADGARDIDDLLERLLLSWTLEDGECGNTVPTAVALRIDMVLTLGGDGTVLWACQLFGRGPVPPVVPMAMGSLGFMTPFHLSRMDAVLRRVTSVAHGFPLMLRHRLRCRILRAKESTPDLEALASSPCDEEALVLNEVVIDRGMTASLANLQCFVDQNFVTAIQGDGLIVSTPTGSTAYNLAAGGSMVHPAVPCILFTPICAHTLSSRPLVFPEHVTLRVKVPADNRAEAYCSFDGRGRQMLRPGDSVLIHVSQWPVPMVCNLDSSHDWFLSVREGLNWNRRVPQKGLR